MIGLNTSRDRLFSSKNQKTGEFSTTFLNSQISTRCGKGSKDNKHNSLHLGRKYAGIFVLGHYLFLEAHSSPRVTLSEQMMSADKYHSVFSRQNGGCCLYISQIVKSLPFYKLKPEKATPFRRSLPVNRQLISLITNINRTL